MASKRPVDITILQANNIKRSRTAAPQAITAVVTIEGHTERFVTNPGFGEDPVWKARHIFFVEEELVSGDVPSDIKVELFDSPQLENQIGMASINIETAMDFYNKAHTYRLLAEGKNQGSVTLVVSVAPRSKNPLLSPSMYSNTQLYGPPLPGEPVVLNSNHQNSSRGTNGYHAHPAGATRSAYKPQPAPPVSQTRVSMSSFQGRVQPVPAPKYQAAPSSAAVAYNSNAPNPALTVEASGYQGYLSMASGQSPHSGSHSSASPQKGQNNHYYLPSSQGTHVHPQGASSTSPVYSYQPGPSHGSVIHRATSDSALNRQSRGRRYGSHDDIDEGVGVGTSAGAMVGGAMIGGAVGVAVGFAAADSIDDDF